jgi:hypothetical protein
VARQIEFVLYPFGIRKRDTSRARFAGIPIPYINGTYGMNFKRWVVTLERQRNFAEELNHYFEESIKKV